MRAAAREVAGRGASGGGLPHTRAVPVRKRNCFEDSCPVVLLAWRRTLHLARTPENMMAAVVGVSLHDCAGFESKHQSDCARPTRADQHAAMSRR